MHFGIGCCTLTRGSVAETRQASGASQGYFAIREMEMAHGDRGRSWKLEVGGC